MAIRPNKQVGAAISQHMNETRLALLQLDFQAVETVSAVLSRTYSGGGRIITAGNGGSSSVASHFVNDLTKSLLVRSGEAFDALCLTDNVATLTAWSNDESYETALSNQVKRFQPEDALVVFSTSGNSKNLVHAVDEANLQSMTTIGVLGCGGGDLLERCTYKILIDSYDVPILEDIFSAITHAICKALWIAHTPDPIQNAQARLMKKAGQ